MSEIVSITEGVSYHTTYWGHCPSLPALNTDLVGLTNDVPTEWTLNKIIKKFYAYLPLDLLGALYFFRLL